MANTNKINILTITGNYPFAVTPVAGIFVHEQAKALIKCGCNVTVISPFPSIPPVLRHGKKYNSFGGSSFETELDGVRAFRVKYFILPSRVFWGLQVQSEFEAIKMKIQDIEKRYGRFDIFHAHWLTPEGYICSKLSKYFKRPCVCTSHGCDLNRCPQTSNHRRKQTIFTLLNVDKVLTVSDELKLEANSLVGKELDIDVITNGADIQKFFPQDKIFLFIGNLITVKGVNFLFDVLERIDFGYSILAIIIGDGPLRKDLQERASAEKFSKNKIRMVGQIPYENIPTWMNAADLFVLPSLKEGFPCVIVEALACGLPVISTTVGGIPEIIKDGRYGTLVPPTNLVALERAIKEGLEKNWHRDLLVRYAQEYTWEINARKNIEIYKKLLERTTQCN